MEKTSLKNINIPELLTGVIPDQIDRLTEAARVLLTISRRSGPALAMVCAKARAVFGPDTAGFFTWANGAGFKGKYIFNLVAIGKLLLALQAAEEPGFERLLDVGIDKIIPITRLAEQDVPRFLAAYQVEDMTREDVRAAVAQCLGEEPKTPGSYQPDLFAPLEELIKLDEAGFARLGQSLDPRRAKASIYSGIGLVEAAIGYFDIHGEDQVYLIQVETTLREEADKVAALRAKKLTELGA